MKISNFKFQILGIILFFSFIFFSYLTYKDLFVQLDFDMTVKLQDKIPRIVDGYFSLLSLIGSFETVMIILLILFFFMNKLRYFFVLGSFVLFHLIEIFGKFFVHHPPPPFLFSRYALDLSFPSSYVRPGFSYPSGHAGRTAFLTAVLLILIWNSKLSSAKKFTFTFCLLTFAFLMFVSRVYLGEHWTTDVIGGALLGASLGFLSASLFSQKTNKIGSDFPVSIRKVLA